MVNDLKKPQKQEYERWQGYANALLLALTVLFAGTTIAYTNQARSFNVISAIFGLAGIMLTVCWFAFEWNGKIFGKPAFCGLLQARLAFRLFSWL